MGSSFFVVHELRLSGADRATRQLAAAQLAGLPRAEDEQMLPLLVSIDDPRDVAWVGRLPALPDGEDGATDRIHQTIAPEPESSTRPRYYSETVIAEHGTQSY